MQAWTTWSEAVGRHMMVPLVTYTHGRTEHFHLPVTECRKSAHFLTSASFQWRPDHAPNTVLNLSRTTCSVFALAYLFSARTSRHATRRSCWKFYQRLQGHRIQRQFFSNIEQLVRGPAEQTRARLSSQVDAINALEAQLQQLSDVELQQTTKVLQKRAQDGEALQDLLAEAFALVREASKRTLGLRHFDVQLMGGIVLHEGGIAEMATGEGKTLVAILPAFLNALKGAGVHIVTANDYLARRDAEWVGQPLRFLGMTVGMIQAGMPWARRRHAYHCDVTYVTNVELGFDYLRDQTTTTPLELRLRSDTPFYYAIVDEVDSLLIDEARTPLIISAQADRPSEKYKLAVEVAKQLQPSIHYTLEEKQRMCVFTDQGVEDAATILGIEDLFNPLDPWAPFVVNALNAKEFYLRDKQYLVSGGRVVVVDEFTGRPMQSRRWSGGLHQAVEAKEGVQIEAESTTLASISYQNLFRLFTRLSGMTGTAATESEEFEEIYGLKVSVIPTNRDSQRRDEEDLVYLNDASKWHSVAEAVRSSHETGRPVLIGTTSIENSELLAKTLHDVNVPCRILNARPENIARESEIIAGSGCQGAVTIATNMAGRGTDILLGGNAAVMAKLRVREALYPVLFPEQSKDEWQMPDGYYPMNLSARTEDFLRECSQSVAQELSSRLGHEFSALNQETAEAVLQLCERRVPLPEDTPAEAKLREAYQRITKEFETVIEKDRKSLLAIGGLLVIGTERHESRRIDNQLRGRCGRQGDPGTTRFFLSLSDSVLRIFGGDAVKALGDVGGQVDVPLSAPLLSSSLDEAQKQVESYFFGIRKDVFEYDQVMNTQREVLYDLRRQALFGTDEELQKLVVEFNDQNMEELADLIDASQPQDQWPLPRIAQKMSAWFEGCTDVSVDVLKEVMSSASGSTGKESLRAWMKEEGRKAIEQKEVLIDVHGKELHKFVRRQVLLTQIDKFWRRHLENMGFIRDSVKFRVFGQRDPVVEYKLEGYRAFQGMMGRIRRNTVFSLFLFMPQPLVPISDKRMQELAGLDTINGALSPGLTLSQVETISTILREAPSCGSSDRQVPLIEIESLLRDANLMTQAHQLRALADCQRFELMEDVFAKAIYIRIQEA